MSQSHFDSLFHLPARELKSLSFARADKLSLEKWLSSLPTADAAKSTRMLYLAIKEICELNTSANTRLELANALNPSIHHSLNALKKSYLNQNIVLPDPARKIALLCHALQNYLSKAYLIAACQASEKMGNLLKKPTQLMSYAIFATLFESSQLLIRHYQLYQPCNDGFWRNVHGLYQLALKYKLNTLTHQYPAADGTFSIDDAYFNLLLWGSIKANQLRQDDIAKLEPLLWQWTKKIQLCPIDSQQETSFVIDPYADLPPIYLKFHQGKRSPACFSFDTQALTDFLQENSSPALLKKQGLTQNLVNHLILAWGVFTDRTFMRVESDSQLNLCIGLSTAHFFLSGQVPFKQFVFGTDDSEQAGASSAQFTTQRRQSEQMDVWDKSLFGTTRRSEAQLTMESIDYHIRSGGNSCMTFTGSDKEKYQHFEVNIVNLSPSGYCLEWDKQNPASIRAGEIIGVKENHQNQWHIGVIRWVRQNNEKKLQIGIELLSPSAEPFAIRLADYEGHAQSDFIRAIILPEIKAARQEQSIIIPTLSFKPSQYLLLTRSGQQDCIQLKKSLSSTASYSQFTYQSVTPLAETPGSGRMGQQKDNDLNDVWDLL